MNRRLLEELHEYFENIGNERLEKEEYFYRQLTQELPYYSISRVSRDNLDASGFDVSYVTDELLEEIADKMSDDYSEQLYSGSLEVIAGEILGIPQKTDPRCPECGSYKVEYDSVEEVFYCESCNHEWKISTGKNKPTMQKDELIEEIKEIISDYGAFNTAEVEAEASPCIYSNGGVSILAEFFLEDGVTATTYNEKGMEIHNEFNPYTDLDADVLLDIYKLCLTWKAIND
jgi:ribosomal protein L37AE/L43A